MRRIVGRAVEDVECLAKVRVAIRAEVHEAVAIEAREGAVGAALHADLRPEVIVAQERLEDGHAARVAVAEAQEVRALADVLHAARRRQALVLRLDFPVKRSGREYLLREALLQGSERLFKRRILLLLERDADNEAMAVEELRQQASKDLLHLLEAARKICLE